MPDEVSENRGIGELQMDLADFDDKNIASQLPTGRLAFGQAIERAARNEGTKMLAVQGRIASAEIEEKLAAQAEQLFDKEAGRLPGLRRYAVATHVRMYLKTPPGLFKEPALIVQSWLDIPEQALTRSGKAIIASLAERYAGHKIRKDFMSRPLHRWQKKHIQAVLGRHGILASISDCKSLSSIKRVILDHRNPAEYETFKAVVKVAKDGSHLIWNGKRFKIFANGDRPSIKRNGKTMSVSAICKVMNS